MTVTTRRERRQQQRRQQQRRASSGGGGGSRRISQIWIVLGVVVAIGLLILGARAAGLFEAPSTPKTDVNAVDVSGAKIGTHQDNIGNDHIPAGQKGNYTEGLPPTSGQHWAAPAAPAPWGTKAAWLQWEVTTHNLEHGGIVIMYNGLTPQQVTDLTNVVRSLGSSGFNKIILEPWPDMPKDSKIILTAWDWILKLPAPDDTSVIKFVRQHTDDEAPENGVP